MNPTTIAIINEIFPAVGKHFGVELDARIEKDSPHLFVVFNDSDVLGLSVKQFIMYQECVAQCFYEFGFVHAYCGGTDAPNSKWFRWVFASGLAVHDGNCGAVLCEYEIQQTVKRAIDGYLAKKRRELLDAYSRLTDEIAEREERRNEIVTVLGTML